MDDVSKDLVSLLLQLFPGFIAAWILYGLTSYPKPSQFERVAQALVFSFLVKVLVVPEHWALLYIGRMFPLAPWDEGAELFAATVTGIAFGLIISYFANNDRLYRVARALGLTRRTAYPSEWYGALTRKPKYVVLHLDGDRRISGWPLQWPSDPKHGHFELAAAAWLTKDPAAELLGDALGLNRGAELRAVEAHYHHALGPVQIDDGRGHLEPPDSCGEPAEVNAAFNTVVSCVMTLLVFVRSF